MGYIRFQVAMWLKFRYDDVDSQKRSPNRLQILFISGAESSVNIQNFLNWDKTFKSVVYNQVSQRKQEYRSLGMCHFNTKLPKWLICHNGRSFVVIFSLYMIYIAYKCIFVMRKIPSLLLNQCYLYVHARRSKFKQYPNISLLTKYFVGLRGKGFPFVCPFD